MDIIKGVGAALAVVAFGIGVVALLGGAVAFTALLIMTAKFWVPALLVVGAVAAVVGIACCAANGLEA